MTNFTSDQQQSRNHTSINSATANLIKQQRVPLIPFASITPTRPTETKASRLTKELASPELLIGPKQHPDQSSIMHHQSAKCTNPTSANNNNNFGSEVWSSVQDLFWDHMREVQNKWNTLKLNDDIWAKLIYFEQNRRLAKAYVSAPVLTIDGSTHGLDGFRIGLSGIDNTYRSLDSMGCLRTIGQGIKLKIDQHGNILIRKIGGSAGSGAGNGGGSQNGASFQSGSRCSVWVKDWPSVSNDSSNNGNANGFVTENCMMREIEQSDVPYKLFDMRNFRSQLDKRRLNNENIMDWRQCVSIISFVRSTRDEKQQKRLLEDPCWIMLINIIAIDMIKSSLSFADEVRSSIGMKGSSLIQNHNLLECSGSSRMGGSSRNTSNTDGDSKSPRRTSSSSSILFPYGQSFTTQSSSGTDTTNNPMVTSERLKKLRASDSSRNRWTAMKNGSHYRRYQSIQQLSSLTGGNSSANSTIYTTFNGKFAKNTSSKQRNPNHADSSSTSDYNSGSRSVSSSQTYRRQQQQQQHHHHHHQLHTIPFDSYQQQHDNANYMYREGGGRVMFSRKSLLPSSLDFNNKSLSLSSFDLSQRRMDLRSIHSSIRMNYDYLTETEDNALDYAAESDVGAGENNFGSSKDSCVDEGLHPGDQEQRRDQPSHYAASSNDHGGTTKRRDSHHMKPLGNHNHHQVSSSHPKLVPSSSSNELKSGQQTTCCAFLTMDHLKNKSTSNEHTNHDQCQAAQGRLANGLADRTENSPKPLVEHQTKLVSGSSIASSSSSSGCADNDYFMSHSSSSMSSSTASNERELFSQPASSSGIICSAGSTSDECDEGERKLTTKSTLATPAKSHLPPPMSPMPLIDMKKDDLTTTVTSTGLVMESSMPTKVNEAAPVETRKHKLKKTIVSSAPVAKTNNRKISQKKMIESPNYCCDQSHMSAANHDRSLLDNLEDQHLNCKCPSLDYACNCCAECYANTATAIDPNIDCGCATERLFNKSSRLSRSSISISNSTSNLTVRIKRKVELERPRRAAGNGLRVSTLTRIDDVEQDFEKISTIPMQQENKNDKSNGTKEGQKHTGSWLERRRYTKIFPKFMFPSSANNNNSRHTQDKSSQRKSQTMLRLTRSSQDLS